MKRLVCTAQINRFLLDFYLENKKGYYICIRITEVAHDLLEKWQSGRLRQS